MATTADLADPDALRDDERDAVEALLFRLADDELVTAERYTEWQVRAPTLESDIALANVAQDEFGHARLWYDLLMDFGHSEADLLFERDPADFRHASLCEQPVAEGDWADTILRSYLYDEAEALRLDALVDSSYPRIRGRLDAVRREEDYHREHAQSWLERLHEGEEGRARIQAALDRLFPYALTLFEPGPNEPAIDELGVRTASLDELRGEWLTTVVPFLESLGLTVPEPDDVGLPDAVGRDGTHTDQWSVLHDEMTRAYRELGRTQATRIMRDPNDAD